MIGEEKSSEPLTCVFSILEWDTMIKLGIIGEERLQTVNNMQGACYWTSV